MSWIQQPTWVGTYAGNYKMAWILAHLNTSYIDDNGQFAGNAGTSGRWVDDPSAPIINGSVAQRFIPDTTDGAASAYQAGTMYGRDGFDLWVLNAQGRAIYEQSKNNPITTNTALPAPTVSTTPTSNPNIANLMQTLENTILNLKKELGL